jgi:hypothetical protein
VGKATSRSAIIALGLALALIASPPPASLESIEHQTARTLTLALDGISYRTVVRAKELGAFEGWPQAVPMVSTFPSVTNVAFTAFFHRFGAEPAAGYEVSHFSREENDVVGGSLIGYKSRLNSWRDYFDITCRAISCKLAAYTAPRRACWSEIDEIEEMLIESNHDVLLAHIGATDALMHIRGEEAVVRFMLELDDRLNELRKRHLAVRGRPLRLVLLSDHGNSDAKIRMATGIRHRLRKAGLNVVQHLEHPDDVVAPTFGLVSYGALHLRPERAETAARAVVDDDSIDLAAWLSGESEISVISRKSEGRILWREDSKGRSFLYDPVSGDPLRLEGALAELAGGGLLDRDGFASEEDWFRVSALGDFPDAPRRLANALEGIYVRNKATVIFSMKPGYAWGWRSAHVSSKLNGGRLEGTHGGLDRTSSTAFFLSDDPRLQPTSPIHISEALERGQIYLPGK